MQDRPVQAVSSTTVDDINPALPIIVGFRVLGVERFRV